MNANADLDLGIPGYKYDVSFNTKAVPLAPLVNSFDPEQKGRLGGTFTAQGKASGTGITGASLQKSLSGQFDLNSTNLNLSVVNVKARWLKALINVVAAVPELLRNPESAIGTLAKSVTGLGGGGLMDELKRSPIDAITAHGAIGSGRVDLQAASVQSPAFRADAKGTITLAPVLTNSTLAVPVSISLAQAVAERVGLAAAGTAGGYAKIPDFYTMKGTIGDPKNDYNKPVLLGIAAKGIASALPNVGGKAGNILGILTGQPAPGTNASPTVSTNQPATNQAPLNNLLDQLLKPKPKKK